MSYFNSIKTQAAISLKHSASNCLHTNTDSPSRHWEIVLNNFQSDSNF